MTRLALTYLLIVYATHLIHHSSMLLFMARKMVNNMNINQTDIDYEILPAAPVTYTHTSTTPEYSHRSRLCMQSSVHNRRTATAPYVLQPTTGQEG